MSFALHNLKLGSLFAKRDAQTSARKSSARNSRKGNDHAEGHLKTAQVTYLFRHLSTLLENGVSLPKAIATLAEEEATERYRTMLDSLRKRLENGESFSGALAQYPATFDAVLISQVKVGERAGTLGESLRQLADHRDKAGKLKGEIIKKLSYPALLVLVGTGVITFLLTYVVPVFEETYASAKVPLPGITLALIAVGSFARSYLLYIIAGFVVVTVTIQQLRKNDDFACRMDDSVMRIPVVGPWLRSIALLQMMEVLGDLLDAGFTLAEALGEAAQAVTNRSAKIRVRELQKAIIRGERFSREMEKHRSFFPPVVSQLVIIGEQTGMLARSTKHIRDHLSAEIERKANVFVAAIEPILTISLAFAVAAVLMAIYLPMFDMINTVGK